MSNCNKGFMFLIRLGSTHFHSVVMVKFLQELRQKGKLMCLLIQYDIWAAFHPYQSRVAEMNLTNE